MLLVIVTCLNPYSNGMLTWKMRPHKARRMNVLILILMECSLGFFRDTLFVPVKSLNPYSNGMLTWSKFDQGLARKCNVLILILMECSLGALGAFLRDSS